MASRGKALGRPFSGRACALFRPLCAWGARPAQGHPLLHPSCGPFPWALRPPCTATSSGPFSGSILCSIRAPVPHSLLGPTAQHVHGDLQGLPHPAVLLGREAERQGPVQSPASLAGSAAVRLCIRILRRKEGLYLHKTRRASPVPGAVGRRLSITWDCSGQHPSHEPGPEAPTPVSTPWGTSAQDLGVHVNRVPPASPCPLGPTHQSKGKGDVSLAITRIHLP